MAQKKRKKTCCTANSVPLAGIACCVGAVQQAAHDKALIEMER